MICSQMGKNALFLEEQAIWSLYNILLSMFPLEFYVAMGNRKNVCFFFYVPNYKISVQYSVACLTAVRKSQCLIEADNKSNTVCGCTISPCSHGDLAHRWTQEDTSCFLESGGSVLFTSKYAKHICDFSMNSKAKLLLDPSIHWLWDFERSLLYKLHLYARSYGNHGNTYVRRHECRWSVRKWKGIKTAVFRACVPLHVFSSQFLIKSETQRAQELPTHNIMVQNASFFPPLSACLSFIHDK